MNSNNNNNNLYFEIKTNAKKSRRFDLSEVIFKWVKFPKLV